MVVICIHKNKLQKVNLKFCSLQNNDYICTQIKTLQLWTIYPII